MIISSENEVVIQRMLQPQLQGKNILLISIPPTWKKKKTSCSVCVCMRQLLRGSWRGGELEQEGEFPMKQEAGCSSEREAAWLAALEDLMCSSSS